MEYEMINNKKYKKCKDTEIRNPKTLRCVSKNGIIGKKILNIKKSKSPIKKTKYTDEECIKWKTNKLKNPISNRNIQKDKGVYNDFNKNCIHIKTPIIIKKSKSPIEIKYTTEECIKWLNNKKIDPKTNKKIDSKTSIYKNYNTYCAILNEKAFKLQRFFLKKKNKKHSFLINNKSCIVKIGKDFIIDNKIKLVKRFGSVSSFGTNYISTFIDDDNFKFSSKIQLNGKMVNLELYILDFLNKERKKTNTLHYPLFYGYTKCSALNINKEEIQDIIKIPKKIGYTIIFNELLLGDLKQYLYNVAKENYDLWLNAIEQIYMCIASFHEIGLKHNDSHYGNFLYKKIKKGGYFHYIINGKDYYIPNLGYLWVIWDFGVCSPLHRHYDYIYDYNLLNLYLRYDNKGLITEEFKNKFPLDPAPAYRNWGNIEKSLKIPDEIQILVEKLWTYTGKDSSLYHIKELYKIKQTEDKWFEFLLSNKVLFNHNPSKDIINITKIDYQDIKSDSILLNNKLFNINFEIIKKNSF